MGVTFDKTARDAIHEVRFRRRAGADAVCQALNALCEKKYPERGSYMVVMLKEETRGTGNKKSKAGNYVIGFCVGVD